MPLPRIYSRICLVNLQLHNIGRNEPPPSILWISSKLDQQKWPDESVIKLLWPCLDLSVSWLAKEKKKTDNRYYYLEGTQQCTRSVKLCIFLTDMSRMDNIVDDGEAPSNDYKFQAITVDKKRSWGGGRVGQNRRANGRWWFCGQQEKSFSAMFLMELEDFTKHRKGKSKT